MLSPDNDEEWRIAAVLPATRLYADAVFAVHHDGPGAALSAACAPTLAPPYPAGDALHHATAADSCVRCLLYLLAGRLHDQRKQLELHRSRTLLSSACRIAGESRIVLDRIVASQRLP